MDLAIVVDGSGSIKDEHNDESNWVAIKKFLEILVGTLSLGRKQTQLAIVTFGTSANLEFDFNQYHSKANILKAIDKLNYDVSK